LIVRCSGRSQVTKLATYWVAGRPAVTLLRAVV
jgi:hypothetical protein